MERSANWRNHRKLWITTLVVSALICVVTLVVAFRAEVQYSAKSVVEVRPTAVEVTPQLLEFQIPSLEVRTVGAAMEERVRAVLPAEMSALPWTVSTQVTLGSGVLSITVQSPDETASIEIANAYARELAAMDLTSESIDVVSISPATKAQQLSTRLIIVVTGLGLALVVLLTVAVWIGTRVDVDPRPGGPELTVRQPPSRGRLTKWSPTER